MKKNADSVVVTVVVVEVVEVSEDLLRVEDDSKKISLRDNTYPSLFTSTFLNTSNRIY